MFLLFLVRLEDVKKLFVRVRDIRKFGLYLVQVLDRVVELSWWLLLYGILVVQVPKKRRGRIRLRTLVKPRRKIRIELWRNMGEVVGLWGHRTRAERRQ